MTTPETERRARPVAVNPDGTGHYTFEIDAERPLEAGLVTDETVEQTYGFRPHKLSEQTDPCKPPKPQGGSEPDGGQRHVRPRRDHNSHRPSRLSRMRWGWVKYVAVAGIAAYATHGCGTPHSFEAEVTPIETRVYPNVELELAKIFPTMHYYQHTKLDRGEDWLVDINPTSYNFVIDGEITPEVEAGIKIERLEAVKDNTNNTMAVTLTGKFTKDRAAIDSEHDDLYPEFDGALWNAGTDNKEQKKAKQSAGMIIEAAAGVSTACAVKQVEVQDLFRKGVVEFLTSMSFLDGIDPANITIILVDAEVQSDKMYDSAVEELDAAIARVKKKYPGKKGRHFEVETAALENCDQQKIVVGDKAAA